MKTTRWVSVIILIFILWLVFSVYWYNCQIKSICSSSENFPVIEKNVLQSDNVNQTLLAKGEAEAKSSHSESTKAISSPQSDNLQNLDLSKLTIDFSKNAVNANLSSEQKNLLAKYVDQIKNKQRKINIIGHTDDLGSDEYNLRLGKNRAKAVARFILKHGVSVSQVNISSNGESTPIVTNDSEVNRAKNRRVELSFAN